MHAAPRVRGQGLIAKHQNGKPSRNPEILSNWVPIKQSNCSINIDTIAKIGCKRKQFPVTPALAITIHKSQVGTFKEIVYKYSFKQSRHLVYVALSRVTDINGLFITTPDNKPFKFKHGMDFDKNSPSVRNMRDEYSRLETRLLPTIVTKAKLFCNSQFDL